MKHIFKILSKSEIKKSRSSAYEYIDFYNEQETLSNDQLLKYQFKIQNLFLSGKLDELDQKLNSLSEENKNKILDNLLSSEQNNTKLISYICNN